MIPEGPEGPQGPPRPTDATFYFVVGPTDTTNSFQSDAVCDTDDFASGGGYEKVPNVDVTLSSVIFAGEGTT